MKKGLLLLLFSVLLFACEKTDKDNTNKGTVTTLEAVQDSLFTVKLSGKISGLNDVALDFEYGIECSFNEEFDEDNSYRFLAGKKYTEDVYSVNAFPIESNRIYYYRAYYINQVHIYYGDIKQFSFKWDKQMLTGTWSASDACNYTINEDYTGLRENAKGETLDFTWKILGNELILYFNANSIIRYRILSINDNSFKAIDANDTNQTIITFYRFVDLGLSVKWATCNLGAYKAEDYGGYYAWGETEEKSDYSWDTYKWCTGSYNTMIKYTDVLKNGHFDKTTLDLDDDAAQINMGGNWRIPTKEEIEELINNSSYIWTTVNGIDGYLITSNKPGYEDRSVFFPGAGCKTGVYNGDFGSCYYWSSSVYKLADSNAYSLEYTAFYGREYNRNRYQGMPIRPVCP